MLVKLKIENFLSFEKESELTMVSSNKTNKKNTHKMKIKSTPLLKYAIIYGANASGKSNLVEAFKFIKNTVIDKIPVVSNNKFCKTKEENSQKPSNFELQIAINDKFYAYGFSILLKERKITEEWLYELYQNGTSKVLFERASGQKPILGENLSLNKNDKLKMKTYLDDFDESSNILFLSFMNRDKKYHDSKLVFFKDIFMWIYENLEIYTPHTSFNNFEYYYDDASLSKISELIRTFDTGISDIHTCEISEKDFKKEIPEELFSEVMNNIRNQIGETNINDFKMSMRYHNNFFNIESLESNKVKITTIKLKHGNSFYDFNFKEESEGTRRLFDLLDILLNKTENKVYVIDEMERSLHPKLTARFIELFDKMHKNQKIQLIFTTHESAIMEQELFRRDEIWFLERNNENNSNIYSLDIFKERYDKKLSKAYLEGRYGAVPIFKSFDFEEK